MIKHILLGKKVTFHDVLLLIWFLRWWITSGRIWTENVKQWYECQTHQKHKKKQRVVKHIWTSRWFQRYQADIVELYKSLTEKGNFNYSLTVIDHFSKY